MRMEWERELNGNGNGMGLECEWEWSGVARPTSRWQEKACNNRILLRTTFIVQYSEQGTPWKENALLIYAQETRVAT